LAARSSDGRRFLPGWLGGYHRAWLVPDVVAGLIVGSVLVPQTVAHAQIAGLPPSAGLAAAPEALIAYALLGTSRSLFVSATTATSALSLSAVGPLAQGDTATFAALSAALAVVTGVILVGAGLIRMGGVMDLVAKPVMTGFLFGLGLTVSIGQLPKVFGVPAGEGDFFPRVTDLVRPLDDTGGGDAGHRGGGTPLLSRTRPRQGAAARVATRGRSRSWRWRESRTCRPRTDGRRGGRRRSAFLMRRAVR
jgi:MFS superfamily sulfate permease-like transporter